MSQTEKEIGLQIMRIAEKVLKGGVMIMSGKVKAGSVNMEEQTVSVVLTGNDAATDDVLLNAVSMNNNGVILYPEDDSDVWVCNIDGQGKWGIIKCSNLKQVTIKQGEAAMTVKGSKYSIKNGECDFKAMMDNFFSHVGQMKFSNGGGTTGVPLNIADLNNDKAMFDKLFY